MAPKKSALSARGASISRAIGRGAKASTAPANTLAEKRGSAAPVSAPSKSHDIVSTTPSYTKEQLALVQDRDDLDPTSQQYNALWDEVKKKMGMPKNAPIHSQHMNRIEHILRVFDLDPAFGPCLGMTRLERWERAEKLGDEPPWEIKQILETKQGILELQQSVLADKGV